MAALDFPASPVDGQTYSNWVYSSSKGAWQAKPLTPGQAQPSATAPTSPSNGDQWYNTNDGNLYIYYNDGDTSQWVQVKSDATLSSTLGNRVTTLESYPSGLVPIVPTSVTVTSGSASVASNGLITFTGVADVMLNGVFTTNFKNYRVEIYDVVNNSTASTVYLRFSTSGTAYTTSSYVMASTYSNSSGATGNWASGSSTQMNVFAYDAAPSTYMGAGAIDVFSPQIANTTMLNFKSVSNSSAVINNFVGACRLNAMNQFDGVQFRAGAGTFSGTIQVYGYRN